MIEMGAETSAPDERQRRAERIEGRWATVSGLRMFYRVSAYPPGASAISAAPMVLIHGLNTSSLTMIRLAEQLAPDVRVYAPDLPGYGRSAKPWPFLNLCQLADVVAQWMAAVGLERATLLGVSFGCQVLSEVAVRSPERVARVVLVSPTLAPKDHCLPRLLWDAWRDGHRVPDFVHVINRRNGEHVGTLRELYTLWLMLHDHIEDRLPLMLAPTLVVRGGRDLLVTETWAQQVTELLPDALLSVVPGVAHPVNLVAPRELARVVRLFLREGCGGCE